MPYFRTYDMVFRMKTTLMIPDVLYREVKQRAAREGQSISELVAELLRAGLRTAAGPRGRLMALPTFDMGAARVDVADRDALERAMRGQE